MATLIASGCVKCNSTFANALREMKNTPGFLDTPAFCDLPNPLPDVYVDDESWMGRGIVATTTGQFGKVMTQGSFMERRPCECGSGSMKQTIYRGHVELRARERAGLKSA